MSACFSAALVLTLGFTVAEGASSEDPQIVKPDHQFIVDARGKISAPLKADFFGGQYVLLKEGRKAYPALATPNGFRTGIDRLGYFTGDCTGPAYFVIDSLPKFFDAIPTYIPPLNGDYYHPIPGQSNPN